MLAKTIDENQQDWDQHMPKLFLLAYRTAIHEATGYTPLMLPLAVHQYVLPVDIMIGAPVKQKESSYTMPEFVSRLKYDST